MQRMCSELLRKAGYERYEISNYSKKGFECRHNMTYWLRGDYLGIGIAAHSLIKDRRFYNGTSLEDYIANAGDLEAGSEEIDASGAAEEEIMLATRTAAGLDADAFKKRYGRDMMNDCVKWA